MSKTFAVKMLHNMPTAHSILFMIATYLCGTIPFGKIIGRVYGVDIQQRGSGNIGFANVRRVLGWRAGILTLAGDILKGLLPTLAALHYGNEMLAYAVGVAAIVGHIFPVWLKFHGGKGIATGLGVMAALQPFAAVIGVAVYLFGCYVSKNSGRSSITGVVCLVATGTFLSPRLWWQYGLLLLVALWTLRKNIAGTVPNYDI